MKILRLNDVMEMTGLARSTVYKLISVGNFPQQIPLGGRSVGFLEAEVLDWIRQKIEARDRQLMS